MISYLANPARFLKFERIASPIFALVALLSLTAGLWTGLVTSPPDEYHGETVRIMYVHVPAAWSAMMAYAALTAASVISFIWRHNLADSAARAFARAGTGFTFLALVTGSLWGKPAWGTWWEWDGRMTSVLILFFIYIAYLAIWETTEDKKQAARLAGILAMVGSVNLPIIKFSVEWWRSLHQPASVSNVGAPGLPPENLLPLGLMVLGYTALFGWLALKHIRADIYDLKAKRAKMAPAATTTLETL